MRIIYERIFLSVGGGFVEGVDANGGRRQAGTEDSTGKMMPYPYNSAGEFVELCKKNKLSPWQLVIKNEEARGMNEKSLRENLAEILRVFEECINNGLAHEGILRSA